MVDDSEKHLPGAEPPVFLIGKHIKGMFEYSYGVKVEYLK
jgi:hypothetical protein